MSQPRTPVDRDGLTRARFFSKQVVLPADLAQDQTYFIDKFRRHERLEHTWGIHLGLEIFPVDKDSKSQSYKDMTDHLGNLPLGIDSSDGTWIAVSSGRAVTPVGDEIYLPQPVFINTTREASDGTLVTLPDLCPGSTGTRQVPRQDSAWYLVMEAREVETGVVKAELCRCGDHPEQYAYSRVADSYRFLLVQSQPVASPYKDASKGKPPPILLGTPDRTLLWLGTIQFTSGQVTSVSNDPSDPRSPSSLINTTIAGTPPTPPPSPQQSPPKRRFNRSLLRDAVLVILAAVLAALLLPLFSYLLTPAEGDSGPIPSFFAPVPLPPSSKWPERTFKQAPNEAASATGAWLEFGNFATIHVRFANKPVRIDGTLDEWDRSGGFRSHLSEPYGEAYSVAAHMMYDRNSLYLAGEVRDPNAMNNRVKPQPGSNSEDAYRGGSVQVHFRKTPETDSATARNSPAPVPQKAYNASDPDLVHIHMWYDYNEGRAKLHLYQLNRAGIPQLIVLQPSDWQSQYKKDRDGRGYRFEYRIGWTALLEHAAGVSAAEVRQTCAPSPNSKHLVCWDVHWSDHTGTRMRAKLTEILNYIGPTGLDGKSVKVEATSLSYELPGFWGTAFFDPQSD